MDKGIFIGDDYIYKVPTLGTNINIQNLKKQTHLDQSYYSGPLKLDFINHSKRKKINFIENELVVVKPNFLTAFILKKQGKGNYNVNVHGKIMKVRRSNILKVTLPSYKKS